MLGTVVGVLVYGTPERLFSLRQQPGPNKFKLFRIDLWYIRPKRLRFSFWLTEYFGVDTRLDMCSSVNQDPLEGLYMGN